MYQFKATTGIPIKTPPFPQQVYQLKNTTGIPIKNYPLHTRCTNQNPPFPQQVYQLKSTLSTIGVPVKNATGVPIKAHPRHNRCTPTRTTTSALGTVTSPSSRSPARSPSRETTASPRFAFRTGPPTTRPGAPSPPAGASPIPVIRLC